MEKILKTLLFIGPNPRIRFLMCNVDVIGNTKNSFDQIISCLNENCIDYKLEINFNKIDHRDAFITFDIDRDNYIFLNNIKRVMLTNDIFISDFSINGKILSTRVGFVLIYLSMCEYKIQIKDCQYTGIKIISIIKKGNSMKKYFSYYNFDATLTEEDKGEITYKNAIELMMKYPEWNIEHVI